MTHDATPPTPETMTDTFENTDLPDNVDYTLKNRFSVLSDPAAWNDLFYAFHVHHFGSFLEASRVLEQSQGTLSQKVARLERKLGYTIFNRTDRGIELTRQGEVLMDHAGVFAHHARGIERACDIVNGKRVIRVVATQAVMSYMLLEPLMAFQDKNPGVTLDFIADNQHLDLIRHNADIVIRPALEHAPGVEQIPLFTFTKRLYASQSYLDRYGTPEKPEDLKHHKLIAPSQRKGLPHSDIHWVLRLQNPHSTTLRKPDYRTNTLECAVAMAEQGLGIVGVYDTFSIVQKGTLVNILEDVTSPPMQWYVCYSITSAEDPLRKKCLKYLSTYFRHNIY